MYYTFAVNTFVADNTRTVFFLPSAYVNRAPWSPLCAT